MLFIINGLIPVHAASTVIGSADGGFESGLTGMTHSGDVRLLSSFGTLSPTQGTQAALMTTEPDSGTTPSDASTSRIAINGFTIPAGISELRLDYNFLTNELTPSLTNDGFTVKLIMVSSSGVEVVLAADTFGKFFPAPWTGYDRQSGFRQMRADISAHAGSVETFNLELRIADQGDGRGNSAIFIDNLRLAASGEPHASSNVVYQEVVAGELITFDASASRDSDGNIVEFRWDFANGTTGIGTTVPYAYPADGVYQGTLTTTDNAGNTDQQSFTIVVGNTNHGPSIVSSANVSASEEVPYQYPVQADDPEVPFGDVLSYALMTAPAGMTIDAATGVIDWIPSVGVARQNPVTVVVTDSLGLTDSQSFTIVIGPEVFVVAVADDSRLYTAHSNGNGSFGPLKFLNDTGHLSRGAAIADFDHDGDFDIVSGHGNNSPRIHLYFYEKQGAGFAAPVYLGPLGDNTHSAGSWLMDMAAEDFNNDGDMDFVVNGDAGSNTWLFTNQGRLNISAENFFSSDFETDVGGWGGPQCSTNMALDNTTAHSGVSSLRVFSTARSCMSVDINPASWDLNNGGSVMTFSYKIPAGVPVGLLFNVNGKGWIFLGGSPMANPGPYRYAGVPQAHLIDDGVWHTVSLDVYQAIHAHWPDAASIAEFEWWTNHNATAGQQFWLDDFQITHRVYVSGFDVSLLPSTGGNGRGMDAADVDSDGNMDFARGRYGDGFIHLYQGDGTGHFTTAKIADPGSDPYGVALADFDSDGIADLFADEGGSGNPYFYKGNGNGTFQSGVYTASLDTNTWSSYAPYDFDDDGHVDIVASRCSGGVGLRYYPGNGDGTFGTVVNIGATSGCTLGVAAPAGRVIGQPFAQITTDLVRVTEGGGIHFDGSSSYDDGSIASYQWDFGDGSSASVAIVDHVFTTEGNYIVRLVTTDDQGITDRRSVRISVTGQAPVADVGGAYLAGEDVANTGRWSVVFDGSASSDLETRIARYEWDFDASDGMTVDATAVAPRHAYLAPGTYTVTLTVYDEVGQSGMATTTVTISAGALPVAALVGPALLDETAASLGQWAGFYNFSTSSDDIGIANYRIDWGDGSSASILAPRHDDFNDGELIYPAWTINGGNWSVVNGELNQTNSSGGWQWLQDLTMAYRDFSMELDFKAVAGSDGYMGLVFHNANTRGNTDSFLMYSRDSWNFWRFYDWKTGTILTDGGSGWNPGVWYHLRLVVVGNNMKLFVTPAGGVETLAIETNDPSHPVGGVGLLSNNQHVIYDNVRVTPMGSSLQAAHIFNAPGNYNVTLAATDHAGQVDTATVPTTVTGNTLPVADVGGPYVLTEADAHNGQWDLIVDGSASTDDHGIQRYTLDFGDGTSYTTGFSDGMKGSYFAAGTDIYGFDIPDARLGRIIATENNTVVEVINLSTQNTIATRTLNRFGIWDMSPGDGVYFKVRASKPVVVLESNLSGGSWSSFVPSLDDSPVGHEFMFRRQNNQGFYVFAIEDTVVRFYSAGGTLLVENTMAAGSYWEPSTLGNTEYRVVATGRIAMQITGSNAYTTVPAVSGDGAGREFYFATYAGSTGTLVAFAHQAANIEVFDLDTGVSLYTHTLAVGEMWNQTGVGTRRLHLVSTGDVEVWSGDNEGGLGIQSLGDDISVAGGQNGSDYWLHNLRDGIVIFAPNNGTTVDIDSGALTRTLSKDGYWHLAPSDFPSGSGVHHILSSRPVIIQTLGRANTYNDEGSYLGGVSARHRYAAVGTYTLTLTAMDRAGQTNTTTTTVDVQGNNAPLAVFTAPTVAGETYAAGGQWTVDFDASGSSDDFGIQRYDWDFGDGAVGTGATLSHIYRAPGLYDVVLTVSDHANQQTTRTLQIEVATGAQPVADAGGPYSFGEAAASQGVWHIPLDGTGSTDDTALFDYLWTLQAGLLNDHFTGATLDSTRWLSSVGVSQNDVATIVGAGSWGPRYLFTQDIVGRSAVFQARVRPVNTSGNQYGMWGFKNTNANNFSFTQMPYALYFTNNSIQIYEDGHFRGTFGSYTRGQWYDIRLTPKSSSGALYEFKPVTATNWTLLYDSNYSSQSSFRVGATVHSGTFEFDDLGDIELNTIKTGATPEFVLSAPAVYNVALRVRDNVLQADTDVTTVTVSKGSPPVADAGGPYTVERGWLLDFNSTRSMDDVNIEQYDWDFGDGHHSTKANPEHFYDIDGVYNASLVVTDNVLQRSTASMTTVTVVTGRAPVAHAGGPYQGAVNGPDVFFDGSASTDDYGIANYFWDVDASVDSDGDGDPTNDRNLQGRKVNYIYRTAGVYTATLMVLDGAGQSGSASASVHIVTNLPPRVVTVPWVSADITIPHETYNGKAITLKGVVHDADPVNYEWDFGDGTTSGPIAVPPGGHHRLDAVHTYPNVLPGTPFIARLTVTDALGQTGSDHYNVIVKGKSLNTEINVAIDESLWYMHRQQKRPAGNWILRNEVATTGSSVNAFEANAHSPEGDPGEDPYVETVRLGLNYILGHLRTEGISVQPAGNPDTNGNGLGIRVNEGSYIYQGGMIMDALITTGLPLRIANNAHTSYPQIKGMRLYDIVQEMVDSYAYGQQDSGGHRGGWRYSWNGGHDNSAAQWAAIGMIPAERNFGVTIPAFVKPENLLVLAYTQGTNGRFGYTSTGGVWGDAATTASGMVQLDFDGVTPGDARWRKAAEHMRGLWAVPAGNNSLLNHFYAMFAFTKAMRLAPPLQVDTFCETCAAGPLDWYNDPTIGFARNLIDKQRTDGSWKQPSGLIGSGFWPQNLVTAWGTLILTRALFEVAPVANAGSDRVWGIDVPLTLDGSGSFHPDPFRSIVSYEWDVDGDGSFDTSSADPILPYTFTRAQYPERTLPQDVTVTLRVTDDRGKKDADTVVITIAVPPHPPLADAGGPYTCTQGVACDLNGSGSFDIDPTDFIARYEWELDGVFPFDFAEASGANPSHIYTALGRFNVGLRVWDNGVLNDLNGNGAFDENERLSDQHFTTVDVVENLPPLADAGGPYVVNEGATVALDGSASTDPNGDVLTYAWDLDGDGLFNDATGLNSGFTAQDNGVFTVSLRVSDSVLMATAITTVTVNNVAPTVNAGPDRVISEGDLLHVNGSFTDPGILDMHRYQWDFGDGSPVVTSTLVPTHIYADNGVYTVTLTVTDNDGGVGSDALIVTVNNVPPVVNAGPDQMINEGGLASFIGHFTDVGVLDTHSYAWGFGDGSPAVTSTLTPSHIYPDNGVYTVTLTVTDKDGGVGSDALIVTVNNVSPVVNAGPDQTVNAGDTVNLAPASFSDVGSMDIHTAMIDWGDGSLPMVGTVTERNGNGAVVGNHSYSTPGIYSVTVTVTDDDGGIGSDTLQVTVASTAGIAVQTVFDLTARAKNRKIDIVWAPVAGADSYNIYRSTTAGGPYQLVVAGHVSSYAVYANFGLSNGTSYFYVVTSVAGGNESLHSNEASATPHARTRRRRR